MKHSGIYLAGIGSYRPYPVTCEQAVAEGIYPQERADVSEMISVLVAGDVPAPKMAASAAIKAIKQAGIPAASYGALIHCATSHQGPAGWSAPHYILNRALATSITAMELRHGCLGAISALRWAADRLAADLDHLGVLVTTADNFGTPGEDRWQASSLFLLGDGAAAAVVARDEGFAEIRATSSISDPRMEALHRGGELLFPPGPSVGRGLNFDARSRYWKAQWEQGNPRPPGDLGVLLNRAVAAALDDAELTLADVTKVCHVGYSREALRDVFAEPLGIDLDRTVWELTRRTGHVGAADPILSLESLCISGDLSSGDHVLLVGAGPGMEVACAVLTITSTNFGGEII